MTESTVCATEKRFGRPRYTGKERDAESGNDYFGARYYASEMGRFLIPDWSAKEDPVPYARLDDPQTLNLYAYMQNDPLGGVDADGHDSAGERENEVMGNVENSAMNPSEKRYEDNVEGSMILEAPEPKSEKLLTQLIFAESTNLSDNPDGQVKEMSAVAYSAINRVSYLKSHCGSPKCHPREISSILNG